MNTRVLSFSVTVEAPLDRHRNTIIKLARSCWGELVHEHFDCIIFRFDWKEGLDAFVDGLKTIK